MTGSKYKLSVIICVYNTAMELFKECLDSVKGSSLGGIEILIIDDGSTLSYAELLKGYNDIKYFKTEHQGILSARILGAEKATAPFVCYLDSDDTLSFDYYEAMLAWQSKTHAEIVINDWAFNSTNAKYICKNDSTITKNFLLKEGQVLKRYFMSKGREQSYHVLWNKLIDKTLLLKVTEIIKKQVSGPMNFAEDMLMTFFLFRHARCVSNVHLGYYFYRLHPGSEVASDSKTKLTEHFCSSAKVFDIIQADLEADDTFVYYEENFFAWKMMNYKFDRARLLGAGHRGLLEELEKQYKIYGKGKGKAESSFYAHQKLLPDNLEKLDDELKKVYYNNKYVKVYAKKGTYAYRTIVAFKLVLNKRFDITKSKKSANIIISNEKYRLKNKIMHNFVAYRLGMLLFPKGSSARKNLKTKV